MDGADDGMSILSKLSQGLDEREGSEAEVIEKRKSDGDGDEGEGKGEERELPI